jgi:hypothetical protein
LKHLNFGDVSVDRIVEFEGEFYQRSFFPDYHAEAIAAERKWLLPGGSFPTKTVGGSWGFDAARLIRLWHPAVAPGLHLPVGFQAISAGHEGACRLTDGGKPAKTLTLGHVDVDGFDTPALVIGFVPKAATSRISKKLFPPVHVR